MKAIFSFSTWTLEVRVAKYGFHQWWECFWMKTLFISIHSFSFIQSSYMFCKKNCWFSQRAIASYLLLVQGDISCASPVASCNAPLLVKTTFFHQEKPLVLFFLLPLMWKWLPVLIELLQLQDLRWFHEQHVGSPPVAYCISLSSSVGFLCARSSIFLPLSLPKGRFHN